MRTGDQIGCAIAAECHEQPLNAEMVAQLLEGAVRSGEEIDFFREMMSDPRCPHDAQMDFMLENGVRDQLSKEVARTVAELPVDNPHVTGHLAKVLENEQIHIKRAAYNREDRRDGKAFVDASRFAVMSTGLGHVVSVACDEPDFLYDLVLRGFTYFPPDPDQPNLSPDCIADATDLLRRAQSARNTALVIQHNLFEGEDSLYEQGQMFEYMRDLGFGALTFVLKDGVKATVFAPGETLPTLRRLKQELGDVVDLQLPRHGCAPALPRINPRSAAQLRKAAHRSTVE
ncbi:hypothetical protein [Caenimonas koreensis]|uniref:hypothetical protein n=1 Tax=Caenimonas koreensis TaxID=367474 RepID=UPI003784E412